MDIDALARAAKVRRDQERALAQETEAALVAEVRAAFDLPDPPRYLTVWLSPVFAELDAEGEMRTGRYVRGFSARRRSEIDAQVQEAEALFYRQHPKTPPAAGIAVLELRRHGVWTQAALTARDAVALHA